MNQAQGKIQSDFPCRLCGNTNLRLFYIICYRRKFKYYRCLNCRLVNYDLIGGLDQTQYIERTDPTDNDSSYNYDKDVSWRFVEKWVSAQGKFLDVGCGSGRLLYLAHKAGWDAHGIELSSEAANTAVSMLDVPVIVGDFLTIKSNGQQYDLIALRHVLEHLVDPILALKKISVRLKTGGYGLFEMPNIDGIDIRLKRWMANAGIHRKQLPQNFIPGHCNEFCRSSFEFLLAKTGFKLVRWETYSMKPLVNFIYTHLHIGSKARALVQKLPT